MSRKGIIQGRMMGFITPEAGYFLGGVPLDSHDEPPNYINQPNQVPEGKLTFETKKSSKERKNTQEKNHLSSIHSTKNSKTSSNEIEEVTSPTSPLNLIRNLLL